MTKKKRGVIKEVPSPKKVKLSEGSFKDSASGKVYKDRSEFFSVKKIGNNPKESKGTKYAIIVSYLIEKLRSNPSKVSVNLKELFKAREGIRESIKNSIYASPKFLPEVIKVLNLKGKYRYSNEVIKDVPKDNNKGNTSGLLSFDLVKI